MKVYRVEFYVKRFGRSDYFIYLQAKNQREAIERARELWKRDSYMFRLSAKRSELSSDYELDMFYKIY